MPFFSTTISKKKSKKKVSFGKDNPVKEIERISSENAKDCWWCPKELHNLQMRGSITDDKESECCKESYEHAQKHVKKITNKCRTELDKADGYWDPKMHTDIAKMAVASSKFLTQDAHRRAKQIYKEVYGKESEDTGRGRSAAVRSRGRSPGKTSTMSERVRSLSPFANSPMKMKLPTIDLGMDFPSMADFGMDLDVTNWDIMKKTTFKRQETEETTGLSNRSAEGSLMGSYGVLPPQVPTDC